MFSFEWFEHWSAFRRDGWVHVKDGVDPEFLDLVREHLAGHGRAQPLTTDAVAGETGQYVFDPPWDLDYQRDLFDVIAPLTGLRRESMTLSERHLKLYGSGEDPSPPPHRDSFSSQISVGLSLEVPPGSHLVLYPDEHRETDPSRSTGPGDDSVPEQLPERSLQDSDALEVYDAPGDVIVFRGSSMWHLRRNSAGTAELQFKLNDFDSDPLGEDPSTPARRRATQAALCRPPGALGATVPSLSRRFGSVVREWSRASGSTSRSAMVWGLPPVRLSYAEDSLLRCLLRSPTGNRTLSDIIVEKPDLGEEVVERAVRRLAFRGVVDLLPGAAAS